MNCNSDSLSYKKKVDTKLLKLANENGSQLITFFSISISILMLRSETETGTETLKNISRYIQWSYLEWNRNSFRLAIPFLSLSLLLSPTRSMTRDDNRKGSFVARRRRKKFRDTNLMFSKAKLFSSFSFHLRTSRGFTRELWRVQGLGGCDKIRLTLSIGTEGRGKSRQDEI